MLTLIVCLHRSGGFAYSAGSVLSVFHAHNGVNGVSVFAGFIILQA